MFLVQYDLSQNLLCQLCKNCDDIVCLHCVSTLSLLQFSSMYYNYFILALLPVSGE